MEFSLENIATMSNFTKPYFWQVFKRYVEPYISRHERIQNAETDKELFENYTLERLKQYQSLWGDNIKNWPEYVQNDISNLFKIGHMTEQFISADNNLAQDLELQPGEWLNRFIDEAKYISDEQLQQAFARLLKEKIYNSNAVNKRVLDILKNMDTNELNTINQYISYFVAGSIPTSIVVKIKSDISWLLELQNLGLMYLNSFPSILHTIDQVYKISSSDNEIRANGVRFVFNNIQQTFTMDFPSYFLTKEGLIFNKIVSSVMPDNVIEFYTSVFEEACKGKASLSVIREKAS